MIKVALIGTHGIRKTTLCHRLVAGLKEKEINADYLGEIAREAKKAGFELNEGTTQASQRWVLHTQIARELEFTARKDVDVLVCDRGLLDNYAYFIRQFGRDSALDMIVNAHMQTYDFLFKVPITEGYLKPDRVRSTNIVFQGEIDDIIEEELRERKIKFQRYEGLEQTIDLVSEALRK